MSDVNTLDFKFHWDFEKGVFEEPENLKELMGPEFELELDYYDEQKQEDKIWMARTGLNYDTLCGAVETIIFMSDKPVSLIKIKNQIDEDLPLRVIHEAISKLQEDYEKKYHGIRLQEVAEGYQFRTKATYSKFVQSLFKVNAVVLSPTALEVLAMVAYKQPVSRSEIEKIRGVDSSHIIRGLMDKRLVKVVGRTEEAGRPVAYGTTPEFLEVFNLNELDQLPPEYELDEVASGNAFGKIQDIKSIVSVGDKAKFDFDELTELDELSKNIKNISSDTLFTKTLIAENKKRNEGEATVKKSAFDILEEFVIHDETLKQNKLASESETPMNVVEARIVDLVKEDGLINAPELDDDYMESLDEKIEELSTKAQEVLESHELSDETHAALEEATAKLADVIIEELSDSNVGPTQDSAQELEASQDQIEDKESTEEEVDLDKIKEMMTDFASDDDQEAVEELFGSKEDLDKEAKELEAALDEAFENLMGSSLDTTELEVSDEEQEHINENEKNLDEALAQMSEKAKDMDLDLDFLNDESNNSNDLEDISLE